MVSRLHLGRAVQIFACGVLALWAQNPVVQHAARRQVGELSGGFSAVSPDGRLVSYMGSVEGRTDDDIFVLDLHTGERRRLTHAGPDGEAGESAISPDGRHVAYGWGNYKDPGQELRVIGVDGSGDRVVYRSREARQVNPQEWSADGNRILVALMHPTTSHFALVSVAEGTVQVLRTFNGLPPKSRPRLSPDARFLAYESLPQEGSALRQIVIVAVSSEPASTPSPLQEVSLLDRPGLDRLLGWMPDGSGILVGRPRGDTTELWVMPVTGGMPHGTPTMLEAELAPSRSSSPGFSRDGSYYYGIEAWEHDVYVATFDPLSGNRDQPERVVSHIAPSTSVAWSPDGRDLAYVVARPVSPDDGTSVLGIWSVATGAERHLRVLVDGIHQLEPRWTQDGRFLWLHGRDPRRREGLYRVDTRTASTVPVLLADCVRFMCFDFPVWPTERSAIFLRRGTGIVARDLETGQEELLYQPTRPDVVSHLALSPDGRQLAFVSHDDGAMTMTVMPASGGERRALVTLPERVEAAWWPHSVLAFDWTADSRRIVYASSSPGTRRVELWQVAVEGGEPQDLGLGVDGMLPGSLSVHPDGRRIAFSAGRAPYQEIWVLENVLP